MFGLLERIVESAAPVANQVGEALFSAPATEPARSESYEVSGVAPDYSGLSGWTEDNDPFGQYGREEDET